MKILAIADIHNNVASVRKLRAQELNGYDAIAIAGDIGTHGAAEVFEILTTFKCPIVYVHGNWDRMPEDAKFGARAHLAHLEVVKVGSLAFGGYSFRGPLPQRLGHGAAEYAEKCRSLLRAAIRKSGVDLQRCVLITHDRARHLDRDFPNLLLHIYGHVHTLSGASSDSRHRTDRWARISSPRMRGLGTSSISRRKGSVCETIDAFH
jgi:predicted phosphodiesterase